MAIEYSWRLNRCIYRLSIRVYIYTSYNGSALSVNIFRHIMWGYVVREGVGYASRSFIRIPNHCYYNGKRLPAFTHTEINLLNAMELVIHSDKWGWAARVWFDSMLTQWSHLAKSRINIHEVVHLNLCKWMCKRLPVLLPNAYIRWFVAVFAFVFGFSRHFAFVVRKCWVSEKLMAIDVIFMAIQRDFPCYK